MRKPLTNIALIVLTCAVAAPAFGQDVEFPASPDDVRAAVREEEATRCKAAGGTVQDILNDTNGTMINTCLFPAPAAGEEAKRKIFVDVEGGTGPNGDKITCKGDGIREAVTVLDLALLEYQAREDVRTGAKKLHEVAACLSAPTAAGVSKRQMDSAIEAAVGAERTAREADVARLDGRIDSETAARQEFEALQTATNAALQAEDVRLAGEIEVAKTKAQEALVSAGGAHVRIDGIEADVAEAGKVLVTPSLSVALLGQPKFEAQGHTLRGGFASAPRFGFSVGKELGNGLQIEGDVGYARVQEQMSADRGNDMLTRGGDLADFGLLVGADISDSPVSLAGYAGGFVHQSGSVAGGGAEVTGGGVLLGIQGEVAFTPEQSPVDVGLMVRPIVGYESAGTKVDGESWTEPGMVRGALIGVSGRF